MTQKETKKTPPFTTSRSSPNYKAAAVTPGMLGCRIGPSHFPALATRIAVVDVVTITRIGYGSNPDHKLD